jgi:hypothetical protein
MSERLAALAAERAGVRWGRGWEHLSAEQRTAMVALEALKIIASWDDGTPNPLTAQRLAELVLDGGF